MATPTKPDARPPTISKRFTTFVAQKTLTVADVTNGSPTGVTWRPCQLVVEADAGDVLAYVDDGGSTVSMAFLATGTYGPFRMSPLTLETSTTANAVTVFWSSAVE